MTESGYGYWSIPMTQWLLKRWERVQFDQCCCSFYWLPTEVQKVNRFPNASLIFSNKTLFYATCFEDFPTDTIYVYFLFYTYACHPYMTVFEKHHCRQEWTVHTVRPNYTQIASKHTHTHTHFYSSKQDWLFIHHCCLWLPLHLLPTLFPAFHCTHPPSCHPFFAWHSSPLCHLSFKALIPLSCCHTDLHTNRHQHAEIKGKESDVIYWRLGRITPPAGQPNAHLH